MPFRPRPAPSRVLVPAMLALLGTSGCGESVNTESTRRPGAEAITRAVDSLAAEAGAEIALYYRNLGTGDSVQVRPDLRFHAASTIQLPVAIRLMSDVESGRRTLDDSVRVGATFESIVDGSSYVLDPALDAHPELYDRVGDRLPLRELVEAMLIGSSNLATNLLVRELGAEAVTDAVRGLGADSTAVLRGVEDVPAFEAELVNTTTARDLATLLTALERGRTPGAEHILGLLERQAFREKIPAGVPAGVRVADKSGWIEGVSHDAAVVYPPSDPPYVLVVMTRGVATPERAEQIIVALSRTVWSVHLRGPHP